MCSHDGHVTRGFSLAVVHLKIEDLSRRLRTGDLGIPTNPAERSVCQDSVCVCVCVCVCVFLCVCLSVLFTHLRRINIFIPAHTYIHVRTLMYYYLPYVFCVYVHA